MSVDARCALWAQPIVIACAAKHLMYIMLVARFAPWGWATKANSASYGAGAATGLSLGPHNELCSRPTLQRGILQQSRHCWLSSDNMTDGHMLGPACATHRVLS
jgi:hypothetical protein